jgi:hypothetical protein
MYNKTSGPVNIAVKRIRTIMANRTYLTCTDSPSKYQELDAKNVSCAASYMVPVFWYMLFDENNIISTSTPCDDDEPDFKYDWLLINKDDGIKLAKSRVDTLINVFGESIADPFNTFIGFLESLNGTNLVVETCELVMMDEKPSKYTIEAKRCISAFSQPPIIEKGFFKKKAQANPNWVTLLGQAEINSMSKTPSVDKLCGYSWESSVPWE